jgi:CRISPR-associated endonuclease/helicase Cas3
MIKLSDCWAKTNPETGVPELSVQLHCMTVGTIARILYSLLAKSVQAQLPKGSITVIAAHDIGKLTPGFLLKSTKWHHFAQINALVSRDGLVTNHAIVSQWHLQQVAGSHSDSRYWYLSTGGHHGSYSGKFKPMSLKPNESDCSFFEPLRDQLLRILINAFGPLPDASAKRAMEHVHLLTGFTIMADWIGSNSEWFTPQMQECTEVVERKCQQILRDLGWTPEIKKGLSFGHQFEPNAPETFQARGIQRALLDVCDAPGLYIVEAPMGLGKTEAALAAAYKRWTDGSEKGLYFALPTQLTSNKIHERINAFLTNIIGKDAVQALIHSNAWLGDQATKRLAPRDGSDSEDLEHTDTDEVLRWYGSTRKALIAPFGTGTIDQALLAVLPARFSALRYFALAGKVVVIDEVHSYDPYMSALIDRLIRFLLKAGCTVIILSATLTAERRAEMIAAAGAEEPPPPESYPLITKVATTTTQAEHFPVAFTSEPVSVEIQHQYLTDDYEDTFWNKVAAMVEAGANVVVIRNSVALAQATYREIKSRISDNISSENIGLLHSRFTQEQRDENEGKWTGLLGKDESRRPRGSLLVSTQIVEQSVDIDADVLITDLAPVELILQRIGRLHRHQRPRPVGFEQAICHILHPDSDWRGDVQSVKATLTPHHYIYPPFKLWQSSVWLSSRNSIRLPGDVRETLEGAAILSPERETYPTVGAFEDEYLDLVREQRGTAKVRDIFNSQAIEDQEGAETRYGMKPTAELVLLAKPPVEQGGVVRVEFTDGCVICVRNGIFSYPLAKALRTHAVRIPRYLVQEQIKSAPAWLDQHLRQSILAVHESDSTVLQAYPYNNNAFTLHYHPSHGLSYEKEKMLSVATSEEDFWF